MPIFLTLIYLLAISTLFGDEIDYLPITPENAAQVEAVNRLQIENSFARGIDFNPSDSSRLAVAQDNGIVSVWSIPDGEILASWRVSTEHLRAVRYMPDGERIVTADFEGNVKVWQASTHELLQTMYIGGEIPLVLDTAQENLIAVGYDRGMARLWNADTGELIITLYGYSGQVRAIDLLPDASAIAFGYSFGDILIYSLRNPQEQQVTILENLDAGELNDLAFYPNTNTQTTTFVGGIVLATASNFQYIQLWDIFCSDPCSYDTGASMAYPHDLAFNHDGSLLVVAGKATAAGGGCLTNLCALEIVEVRFFQTRSENAYPLIATLEGHTDFFEDVSFSPDDRFIASASNDGVILIWGVLA